ncbi:MAG: ATP-binding protein [Planctomycetota bacterium]
MRYATPGPSGEGATPLAGGIPFPAPDDDHILRREAFLILFCAAFAAAIFLLWTWFRKLVLPLFSPEIQPSIVILKDILGPFLTAYLAARLYNSMVLSYEKQLERHRALFTHILDTSADGIVSLDATNHITTWNRGAEQIFGYEESEILGQHAHVLFPEDVDFEGELEQLRESVKEDGLVRNHYGERITRDGRRIRTEVSTTILRDARGEYAGRASIFRDVTERDRIRNELARRESLAAIGEMAAAVAHEIKNPLAGIGGAVQVIGRAFPEDDPRTEVVQEVQDQVKRLDKTIREMLTFARPATPHYTTLDLREFLDRIMRVLGEEPQVKNHAVVLEVEAGLEVEADPQLMENIVVNLILNAAQAIGRESGTITVRATETPQDIELSVTDNGPGIPDDVLPRLFKPFFTTKTRGTGLGLTIVRKFVGVMGGRIEVETGRRKGTSFTVALPRTRLQGA